MRVHLLALPNTETTREYALDGFSQMTIRFAEVLRQLGAEVYLYAGEANEAPCHELVTVIQREEQQVLLGMGPWEYQYANIEEWSPLFQLANARATIEIGKRKQAGDLICQIGGCSQRFVSEHHPDLMTVEYSIGYAGSFSPYRVFESYAWMHETYGRQQITDGRWYDTVIPGFFDPTEFPVSAPEPFLLYVGRLVERKGVRIACQMAEAAGLPLRLIGHGDQKLITYGEYLGTVDVPDRNRWMARALAVLTPTIYLEPFNCVAVEAQLCGTPVIASDWGGFTETVEQGRTGFRCRTFQEFVAAVGEVGTLDRAYIRSRAQRQYSVAAVVEPYRQYFARLADLRTPKGWYATPEAVPA